MTFATREVEHRTMHPAGWPRCDSFPVATPIFESPKLRGIARLDDPRFCPAGHEVTIQTDVPASALRRFLATCSTPTQISGYTPGLYRLGHGSKRTPALLAQIAASELVTMVSVDCQVQYSPSRMLGDEFG